MDFEVERGHLLPPFLCGVSARPAAKRTILVPMAESMAAPFRFRLKTANQEYLPC